MTTGRGSRADASREPAAPARRAVLRAGVAAGIAGAAPLIAGCDRRPVFMPPPVVVHAPGRPIGHRLRERWRAGPPAYSDWRSAPTLSVDVAIVGSGVAGLACAWRLQRAGHRDHRVLAGPEFLGNAAGTRLGGLRCPAGSHYLPLPSRESVALRELLAEAGVLQSGVNAEAPTYDERVLVHAPSHRVLAAGAWEEGSMPLRAASDGGREQSARFLARMASLSAERGADGRRAFVVPIALASGDAPARALDRLAAAAWLDAEGFVDPALRWYLEYCARDEFGATLATISAWALAHYFASRMGAASNAEPGAVLTWEDGLAPLARRLAQPAWDAGRIDAVSVERIEHERDGVRLFGWRHAAQPDDAPLAQPAPVVVRARRAVVAAPPFVAARLVPELAGSPLAAPGAGGAAARAPWTVANVLMRGAPRERHGGAEHPEDAELAWDSIVHGSPGLGFVHAQHQRIGFDVGGPRVLSAYRAYPSHDADALDTLRRLSEAPGPVDARAWLALVGLDLEQAYGSRVWHEVEQVSVTVRGHGMAFPAPGFLDDPALRVLQRADGALRFAHSELSGCSVFEEALWWGVRAADGVLGAAG
jgi:phytoene dehydrogenase-like protein